MSQFCGERSTEADLQLDGLSNEQRGNAFEFVIERLIAMHVPKGSTTLDVGASYGGHTHNMLSAVGRNGKVVAFEPLPRAAATLERWRKKRHPNLTLHQAAVSDRAGKATFRVAVESGYSSLFQRSNGVAIEDEIAVRIVTIDEAVGDESNITFIKVDVEGAELYALRGAAGTLQKHKPIIALEIDWHFSATAPEISAADFLSLVETLKYEVFSFSGRALRVPSPKDWYVLLLPAECSTRELILKTAAEAITEFARSRRDWDLYQKFR